MKESDLLEKLKETAKNLNVEIQTVNLRKYIYNVKGGLCMVNGQYRIIVDKGLYLSEKIDVVSSALQKIDTGAVELDPEIQKLFFKDAGRINAVDKKSDTI